MKETKGEIMQNNKCLFRIIPKVIKSNWGIHFYIFNRVFSFRR